MTIAFVDSGYYPHPELRGRILKFVDVSSEAFTEKDFHTIRPSSWHGTMVTCSACGNGKWSNGYYRGIASGSNVVLIKAFDGKKVKSSYILKSLLWIIAHHKQYHIRVVSVSVGGDRNEPSDKSRICKAIFRLHQLGITVIAAAGNNSSRPVIPPASCRYAIAVGGIYDHNDKNPETASEYGSAYGMTLDGLSKPEIVAHARYLPAPMLPDNFTYTESETLHALYKTPASTLKRKLRAWIGKTHLDTALLLLSPAEIKKSIRQRMDGEKFIAPGFQHVDGTSFAAPIVAAVVAQMLEANPSLTPTMIRMILETTAKRVPTIAPEKQGFGLIQAKACVEQALTETSMPEIHESPLILKDRIVFLYYHRDIRKVHLVGDFTNWQKNKLLLVEVRTGVWRVDIPLLEQGQYSYKFLIDDTLWVEDPLNPHKQPDP
ncbi:MAG TPA: S8 family serine peptidase, partial [bacterium]|nr:S8 family serine peptidase [bacterium]